MGEGTGARRNGAEPRPLPTARFGEHLDPYSTALLAALPEPNGEPVGGSAADLLAAHPEPDTRAELDERVADITARLDRIQHRPPSGPDHDLGIGL